MRRLLPALSCALIAMAAPAQARTAEDEQFWLNLTAMGPISGDLVYFAEIQPRFGDGVSGVDQTILRGGLGWKLSHRVTVYQGYAHVVLPVDNGRDVNEERSSSRSTGPSASPGAASFRRGPGWSSAGVPTATTWAGDCGRCCATKSRWAARR